MKRYPKSWSRETKIRVAQAEAERERRAADLERRTVYHAPIPWLGAPIAVNAVYLPIFPEEEKKQMLSVKEFGQPVSVDGKNGKLFPSRPGSAQDANDQDYTDGTADGIPSDDDDSAWSHAKKAMNHLEMCTDADSELCDGAPRDGSPDHLALAARHIQESLEQRARAGRRDLVSQNSHHTRVRFETQTRE